MTIPKRGEYKTVSAQMPLSLYEKVEAAAADEFSNVSDIVRRALLAWLRERENAEVA